MYNEKSKERTMRYMKEKREKLTLNFPLGYKDKYKQFADSQGISLTSLIIELIDKEIEKQGFKYTEEEKK
ncbi:MAG: hypothetical protein ACLU4K_08705 [Oscillospiraceae bacterium]